MLWVTREGAHVDRVACPWLIRRFIDREAEFLFVPADQVLETARARGGKSFDAKGADYTHTTAPEGELSSFVTLMRAFGLWGKDPALDDVAKVVNHADVRSETSAYRVPEGDGLKAIAHGFALTTKDDQKKLELEFPVYDALYSYFQKKGRPSP
jgi:hypothetical protein